MLKILSKWIQENYREYVLIVLLFIIGIFTGVLVVNNCDETQKQEIGQYIENLVTKFKTIENVHNGDLIVKSINSNLILAIAIWILGTTVIGLPVILGMFFYKGIRLGFTIAFISYTYGKVEGIMICMMALVLQNIILLPATFTIGVSSIKLCKSIIKDRDKENIKNGIIRHTIISIVMIFFVILSSIIENSISLTVLKNFIKYF